MATSLFTVVKRDDFTVFTHSRIIRLLEVHYLIVTPPTAYACVNAAQDGLPARAVVPG